MQVNEEITPQEQPKAPKRSGVSTKNIPLALRPGNYLLVRAQELLNYAFDPSLNPLYFLGSITFLLFWVLLGTGTYLFMFYQMNPVGAYESIQYMTEDQKYYGGIIRSLHRYAADGLVIAIGVHILQVLFSDRFRKYRWFAWVSGALILPVIWFEGASGYFLVWDESAQMLALVMGDLINALPMNAEPFPRAFLINDSVNPTLFFVMDFLHLAIPILLLILAWVHCMRISMPLINPPAKLTIVILFSLLALSLIKPALSGPPADLSKLVHTAQVDWFYLPFIPLIQAFDLSPGNAWLVFAGGYIAFLLFPWLIRDPKKKEVNRQAN